MARGRAEPVGPYEFEATFQRTGRWVFARSTVFVPGTDQSTVSTGSVFGYDDRGITVHAFGGDGVRMMRVAIDGSVLRFEWHDGDAWGRTRLEHQPDGTIDSRGEIHRPGAGTDVLVFKSVYRPGAR